MAFKWSWYFSKSINHKIETTSTPTLFSNEKKNAAEKVIPEKIIEDSKDSSKEIERIVIFFKDGSFKNYSA